VHWRRVVGELSHRLKAAGLFQYADRLDRELASLGPRPTPKDEVAALRRVSGALAGIRISPLLDLAPEETRKLGELRRQAMLLVRRWLRLKECERQERERVAKAIKPLLAALPKPALGRNPPHAPTIWHHGDRAYSRDGINSLVVTEEEDNVLQTFLESGRAMQTRAIEDKSGVTNVSRVIGRLREGYEGVFADAIRTPGGKKGAGGYHIRVRNIGPS
jgi:hypothetical protein